MASHGDGPDPFPDVADSEACPGCQEGFEFSSIIAVDFSVIKARCDACGLHFEVPNRNSQKLKLQSQEKKLFTACRHCKADFIMSSVENVTAKTIHLHCCECDGSYDLDNTEEQRKFLTNKKNSPTVIEAVDEKNVGKLFPGDVIAWQRHVPGFKGNPKAETYQHHAVVESINMKDRKLHTIEFALDLQGLSGDFRKATVKRITRSFDDIVKEYAFVRRYMPQDCLPYPVVVGNAQKYADDLELMASYHLQDNNCQHLASLCKTGERSSEEARKGEKWYVYLLGGAAVLLTLFPYPWVRAVGLILAGIIAYNEGMRWITRKELTLKGFQCDGESLIINGIKTSLSLLISNLT